MGDYVDNKNQKIYNLALRSKSFVYQEKYKQWIQFIISSIMNNDNEAETTILAMESLERGMNPSEVLDILY